MNIHSYLKRINYNGGIKPDFNTLRNLHRAHLFSVPFENLSIHTGEWIRLDLTWLFNKIVDRHRGGFCYELNGLFSWLLGELEFDVTTLSARVRMSDGDGFGPEFDHLVLLVELSKRYLVDVGFGGGFLEPLELDIRKKQVQPEGMYQIQKNDDEFAYTRWSESTGEWKSEYLFTLQPRKLSDFNEMCRFHQKSRRSPFTQRKICTLPIPNGRVTLKNEYLIETTNGIRTERKLINAEIVEIVLEEYFGIDISSKK